MNTAALVSAFFGVAGLASPSALTRQNVAESFWLAVWGLTLIFVSAFVRMKVRTRQRADSSARVPAVGISAGGLETANS